MIDTAQPEPTDHAFDARGEQIAAVYAKAFVGAGQAAGQLSQRIVELDHLIEEILNRHPRFEELLASALISQRDKLGILDRVLGGRLSAAVVDFCKVLCEHGRLDLLRSAHRQIHVQHNALRGLVAVRVGSAAPLPPEAIEKLMPQLRKLSGGEPVIEYVVDPGLIGGIVLRIGDTVYDGSIARRLEQVRENMIERTVHEIQSRRDSFRSTDGN